MTRDETFLTGIEALGLHVEPSLDTSALEAYVVVSYSSDGTLYGDDAPILETRTWQVVYVSPLGYNCTEVRDQLRSLIFDVYGDWPSEENVSDAAGQKYLYEFTSYGGLDDGAA